MKLEVPPIPIESIKKEKNKKPNTENEVIPEQYSVPQNKIETYEIWKVFLEENPHEIISAYVVISANFVSEEEYKKGVWKNIRYRGCYHTSDEAKNEIDGYLR